MEAFREGRLRRSVRQAVTIARAVRAGRARVKAAAPRAPLIDGPALRDLVAEAAADAQLVDLACNRPQWTTSGLRVAAGEQVTWLAWGFAYVIKPLGIGVWPRNALGGRVTGGALEHSARDTFHIHRGPQWSRRACEPVPGRELDPDLLAPGHRRWSRARARR